MAGNQLTYDSIVKGWKVAGTDIFVPRPAGPTYDVLAKRWRTPQGVFTSTPVAGTTTTTTVSEGPVMPDPNAAPASQPTPQPAQSVADRSKEIDDLQKKLTAAETARNAAVGEKTTLQQERDRIVAERDEARAKAAPPPGKVRQWFYNHRLGTALGIAASVLVIFSFAYQGVQYVFFAPKPEVRIASKTQDALPKTPATPSSQKKEEEEQGNDLSGVETRIDELKEAMQKLPDRFAEAFKKIGVLTQPQQPAEPPRAEVVPPPTQPATPATPAPAPETVSLPANFDSLETSEKLGALIEVCKTKNVLWVDEKANRSQIAIIEKRGLTRVSALKIVETCDPSGLSWTRQEERAPQQQVASGPLTAEEQAILKRIAAHMYGDR